MWHRNLPHYLFTQPLNWEVVKHHIFTIMSRYKSLTLKNGEKTLFAWDVINEPIEDVDTNGQVQLRNSIFKKYLGENYLKDLFTFAKQVDPQSLLLFNEHSIELPGPKSDFAFFLLRELRAQGVPIDGIGFQLHIPLWGKKTLKKFENNVKRFIDLGFKVMWSEVDVTLFHSEEEYLQSTPQMIKEKLDKQKFVYKELMNICLRYSSCIGMSPWGLSDHQSWIRLGLQKKYELPLIFNEKIEKKPAYWGIHESLRDL